VDFCVPVVSVSPTLSQLALVTPWLYVWSHTLPCPANGSDSSSTSALTTITPTPCRATRHLVAVSFKTYTGVQYGHDDLSCGYALFVHIDRNAPRPLSLTVMGFVGMHLVMVIIGQ